MNMGIIVLIDKQRHADDRPHGCYVDTKSRTLHFNHQQSGVRCSKEYNCVYQHIERVALYQPFMRIP